MQTLLRTLVILVGVGLVALGPLQCKKQEFAVELKDYIVNLSDAGGNRFLKTKMKLVVENPKVVEEISGQNARISDEVITFLSTKKVDELISPMGKTVLKRQLKDLFNEKILKNGDVLDIFFLDFVIQ
jgi:flagellar FliL protein